MDPIVPAELIVGSRSKLRVLRQLRGVQIPLSTLELARRSGLSQPAVASAVRDLAAYGVVRTVRVGQAWAHTLVRDNAYVLRMVEPVLDAERAIPEEMLDSVINALADCAASVVVFGSWARGEQGPDSDLDVVVVARPGEQIERLDALVDDLGTTIRRRFGSPLSVLLYSPAEAAGLCERAPALYAEIERDGIVLSGPSPESWGELHAS